MSRMETLSGGHMGMKLRGGRRLRSDSPRIATIYFNPSGVYENGMPLEGAEKEYAMKRVQEETRHHF